MAKTKKKALLALLQKAFPAYSKEQLYSKIMAGLVKDKRSGEGLRDPKQLVPVDSKFELSHARKDYVSRGAYKLLHALEAWHIPVSGLVCIDAGSSTGGFTDVLLQEGAARVYAVDVGYNQLDYSLRTDERVMVMERTNIMDVHDLAPQPQLAVADLSFRSLRGAAKHLVELASEGRAILLLKPQFEAHSDELDNGIVKDEYLDEIMQRSLEALRAEVQVKAVIESPIQGTHGNREFLVYAERT